MSKIILTKERSGSHTMSAQALVNSATNPLHRPTYLPLFQQVKLEGYFHGINERDVKNWQFKPRIPGLSLELPVL